METTKPLLRLTAEHLMRRDGVTIPRQMPMREAAQLLRRAKATSAPVVDELGRRVGVLSVSDLLRWAEEGGSGAEYGHVPSCYYQTKGLVPGSPEVVTCTLAEGSCALQVMQPTSGGRRVALCRDPHCFCSESQLGGESASGGESGRYMTADHVTAGLSTPLPELARKMIDAHTHRIHIIDDDGRPVGVVFGTDLLALLSWEGPRRAASCSVEVGAPSP